jgi:hypothetical protein
LQTLTFSHKMVLKYILTFPKCKNNVWIWITLAATEMGCMKVNSLTVGWASVEEFKGTVFGLHATKIMFLFYMEVLSVIWESFIFRKFHFGCVELKSWQW